MKCWQEAVLRMVILALMTALGPSALPAVDAGDTCATAGVIVDNGSYAFNSNGASADNPCRAGTPTVWYQFTPPRDVWVEVDTCGTSFDNIVWVYTDSCPAACSGVVFRVQGNPCGGQTIAFHATRGRTYYFAVGGNLPGDFGSGLFTMAFTPVTAADACADAPQISPDDTYAFNNEGASADDPCRQFAHTVWYSFTAPARGELLVETCGLANFDTFLSAFQGDCPASCDNRVAFNDDAGGDCGARSRIVFPVQAGLTYKIALSGFSSHQGSGQVLVAFTEAPALPGDINGDDIVNVADVTMLANMLAAGTPPEVAVGDVNGDGDVDWVDVGVLAQMIVND